MKAIVVSKPNLLSEVSHIVNKKEADEFFKKHAGNRFEFINSYVNKKGNYVIEIKRNLEIKTSPLDKIQVRNFPLFPSYQSETEILTVEFTDKFLPSSEFCI